MSKLSISTVLAFVFSVPAFSQPANIYTFPGPDVDLGQSYIGRVVSGGHYIGGRGDTIYVLRELNHTYCHKSTDGGQTFSPGVRVNSTPSGAVNASLQVDTAGVVYVAYQGFLEADIFFTKSTDGGQTFSPGVKVNDDTVSTVGQSRPAIAINNKNHVFITWADRRTNPPSAFAAASYDGGLTFNPNIQINTPGSGGGSDIVADDSGRVYVIYGDTIQGVLGVVVARSEDSCKSFNHRKLVSEPPGLGGPASADLSDRMIGVAWKDIFIDSSGFTTSIHFSTSADHAQVFSPNVIIDDSGQPESPSLALKNSIFYTAWRAKHQRTPSGPFFDHIWFSYSTDSGKTFVPFVDVVPDDVIFVPHFNPTIWVGETEKVFVAWTDPRWDPFFNEDHHLFVSVGKPLLSKGDLNFDGIINMVDIVLELNAVFSGQSFPAPFHRADGNCDRQLSPTDLVILLNRSYLDIPFPCN